MEKGEGGFQNLVPRSALVSSSAYLFLVGVSVRSMRLVLCDVPSYYTISLVLCIIVYLQYLQYPRLVRSRSSVTSRKRRLD